MPTIPPDVITIAGLRVSTRIGASSEERRMPQDVAIHVWMEPAMPLSGLRDDLANTIDYSTVAGQIAEVAARGERKLIESLAEEIARTILARHPVATVRVEVRKFVLPNADHVSVSISMTSGAA